MIDEPLTWHDGATVEGIPAPARKAPKPLAGAGTPLSEGVHSIPSLTEEKNATGDLMGFKTRIRSLPTVDTPTLIVRIATTTDPLMLWAVHCTLDKREIAPALRWPINRENPQSEFVTYAADVLWHIRRNPHHYPAFKGWRGAFTNAPASPSWHATVHRQFMYSHDRGYSQAHQGAKGLGLYDTLRQPLAMLPTNTMQAERRQLQGERFAELRANLLTHALANADKSGIRRPEDTANRRARLWSVYILSGRCKATTAKNWFLLTGETNPVSGKPTTRQALDKQLEIVANVIRHGPKTE